MQNFISTIINQIINKQHEKGWQDLFNHLGIKGNETCKGEKPVTEEKSNEIFLAVETCLQNVKEDRVINKVLDGIHNLTPYMAGGNALDKYNALHNAFYMEKA